MSQEVFLLSALLPTLYPPDAEALFAALAAHDVPYALLDGTRDVWVRDFMPEIGRAHVLNSSHTT